MKKRIILKLEVYDGHWFGQEIGFEIIVSGKISKKKENSKREHTMLIVTSTAEAKLFKLFIN